MTLSRHSANIFDRLSVHFIPTSCWNESQNLWPYRIQHLTRSALMSTNLMDDIFWIEVADVVLRSYICVLFSHILCAYSAYIVLLPPTLSPNLKLLSFQVCASVSVCAIHWMGAVRCFSIGHCVSFPTWIIFLYSVNADLYSTISFSLLRHNVHIAIGWSMVCMITKLEIFIN